MRYFDLHCDTLTEILGREQTLTGNGRHVDLAKTENIDEYVQLFAVFIPDEKRGKEASAYFDRAADLYDALVRSEPAFGRYEDSDARFRGILTVESLSACGGTIEGIVHLAERGVRVATLTWNGQNEIASGAFAEDTGITPFGREALRTMRACGMIPDVSHLGKKSFSQLCELSDDVFIATHSNCDLTENPFGQKRNLEDWQIREIVARHGLIGINFCEDFLGDNGDTGFEAVRRHIEHFLDVGAVDVLAFGSDFDGCTIHPSLAGIDKMPALHAYLLRVGVPEKIFFDNADHFFKTQLAQKG